ncbi:hypothetical protein DH2020_041787 [Rehmannia glutinosa]|uniref:Endoplasmic reticulum transmembrane protein n=1 Tax=Rehmannia glutinosa TaxID=99300 RepID=A0ABR0UR00_REHGL
MIQLLFTLIFAGDGADRGVRVQDTVKAGDNGPGPGQTWTGPNCCQDGDGDSIRGDAGHRVMRWRSRGVGSKKVKSTQRIKFSMLSIFSKLLSWDFTLFLALMIDRLHHYIRELRLRRKSMEAVKKQNQFLKIVSFQFREIKVMEEEMTKVRGRIKQLETQLEEKTKEASSAKPMLSL